MDWLLLLAQLLAKVIRPSVTDILGTNAADIAKVIRMSFSLDLANLKHSKRIYNTAEGATLIYIQKKEKELLKISS